MRIRPDVELANKSDVGCVREQNEDYFLYFEPEDELEFSQRGRLMVVSDGMGGRNGGEVASSLAAESIREVFLAAGPFDPRQVLIEGFQLAHQAILERGMREPAFAGMGTTCCAAIFRDGHMYYGHVGDSRIYLIRDHHAEQLTEDHSLVASMVRNGLLTAEQAQHHAQRNVITQALGVDSESLSGDFPSQPLQLATGDIVLFCTDGLHGLVNGAEMALTVQDQSLAEACGELVSLARLRGGPDNITLQMLGIRRVEK
jgi:protein phosphatase